MKYIIIITLFVLQSNLLIAKQDNNDSILLETIPDSIYFDTILKSASHNGYYLAFNIKSPTYNGRIVTVNRALVDFVTQTKGIKYLEYKKLIKGILINNDTLKTDICIDSMGIMKWKFEKVYDNELVKKYSKLGRIEFYKYFFKCKGKTGVLKGKVDKYIKKTGNRNIYWAIINQLCIWRAFVGYNSYTGDLGFRVGVPVN